VPDREELAVAAAVVTLERHLVFPVLVELDMDSPWSSMDIARLAVPDGALHEGDRFGDGGGPGRAERGSALSGSGWNGRLKSGTRSSLAKR
jgi:hypothetical protein